MDVHGMRNIERYLILENYLTSNKI
jgi:hypothetical protein